MEPDDAMVLEEEQLKVQHGIVDDDGATGRPGFYAGGDCINGGKEVVNAAHDGKRAAERYAEGYDEKLYAFHWLGQSFLYDYLGSLEPKRPIMIFSSAGCLSVLVQRSLASPQCRPAGCCRRTQIPEAQAFGTS